jgi:hypothetical protein
LDGATNNDETPESETISNKLQWMLASANCEQRLNEANMHGEFVRTDLPVFAKHICFKHTE